MARANDTGRTEVVGLLIMPPPSIRLPHAWAGESRVYPPNIYKILKKTAPHPPYLPKPMVGPPTSSVSLVITRLLAINVAYKATANGVCLHRWYLCPRRTVFLSLTTKTVKPQPPRRLWVGGARYVVKGILRPKCLSGDRLKLSMTKIMRHLPRMYHESLTDQCRQSLGGWGYDGFGAFLRIRSADHAPALPLPGAVPSKGMGPPEGGIRWDRRRRLPAAARGRQPRFVLRRSGSIKNTGGNQGQRRASKRPLFFRYGFYLTPCFCLIPNPGDFFLLRALLV